MPGARQTMEGLLEVQHRDGSIVTSDGVPLLDGLPVSATVRAEPGCAVVGLQTSDGALACRADFLIRKLHASRFLALGRTSLWWSAPAWGTSTQQVPEETQFLLVELPSGTCGGGDDAPTYALLLPLIDSGAFRATLRPASRGDGEGALALRIESGAADVAAASWPGALLVAAGRDPYALVDAAVAAAARLSGTSKPRSDKEVPASADVFGWCTWDAFYSKVSAAGLSAGLSSLAAGGAPPRFLIIDDGWQRTDVDKEFRAAAASGCAHTPAQNGVGMGSAVHEVVEEAAAGLLSGPDNHMDQNLAAIHQIQREDGSSSGSGSATEGTPSGGAGKGSSSAGATAYGTQSANGGGCALTPLVPATSTGRGGLLAALEAAVRAALGRLAAGGAQLEAAFLNKCRQILETTPAHSPLMRLFSALATSRLLRRPLLSFYASVSDHTRRLVSISANAKFAGPSTGPASSLSSGGGDLAAVVKSLKEQHGVAYVYAWHAMMGFWGGVGLQDEEMQRYKPELVMPTPTPGMLTVDPAVAWVQPVLSGVALPADPSALHRDMHAYLAGCGVDGVKVDVQSTVGLLGSGTSRGGGAALAAAYHASLEASAAQHFPGNQLINCMCHSSEDLYRMENTAIARTSDDFYPTNEASWHSHVANCAYNSLFFGALVIPDWDMFHSQHAAALLHATARAISGGPVYVSDRPGRHDFALLRRLVLPDGAVLRCRLPGRPTADCLLSDVSRDGVTALKVWSANAATGAVAVFNIQGSAFERDLRRFHKHAAAPPALTARVGPADVPPLAGEAEQFAAYVDSTQELSLLAPGEAVEVHVAGGGGSDIVTLCPVARAGDMHFAPIGLPGMLNSGGAVMSCSFEGGHSDDGFEVQPARASMTLRGAGPLLCYASHSPCSVVLGGAEVPFEHEPASGALRFELLRRGGEPASAPLDCTIQF
ncbi:raffinose synthase [Micractinium conductrix]|uniref:Raffinose synthase n=1 Tax=Micractinium conductrix TaxID=554055 RepID=A0A2P6VBK5_9CHLO|nr:raffinose synthase [Micractinium conductrix]|eukprot:PSC71477.1 raffinose synthase [Micractinium conductrix]